MQNLINGLKKILKIKATRDYSWVFGGQLLASMLRLASLSILISALGHEGNGILLGVQALSYLFGDLTNPYCFQSVIKYLSMSTNKKEKDNIIAQGFTLDFIAGFLGIMLAIILIRPISAWLGYSNEIIKYLWIYLPCVYFRHVSTGTAMGLLRSMGKFSITIILYDVQSLLRIVFYAIILSNEVGIEALIVTEMLLEVFYAMGIMYMATIFSRKNDICYPPKRLPIFEKAFLKFNFLSMASTTVDMVLGNVSSIFISKYLGVSLLSIYKTLEKTGSLISRFSTPVSQIIYPDFCRAIADKRYKDVKQFIRKYMLLVGPLSILGIIVGTATFSVWRIIFDLNTSYLPEVSLYITFAMISCLAVPIHSFHTAFGLMHYNLINVAIINTLYCLVLIPVLNLFALRGLIILLIAQAVVMVIVKWIQEKWYMRRLERENSL